FILFRILFFFSSRRRHTRSTRDWSSDVCSSDLPPIAGEGAGVQVIYCIVPRSLESRAREKLAHSLTDVEVIVELRDGERRQSGRSEERRVGKECRGGWWGGE